MAVLTTTCLCCAKRLVPTSIGLVCDACRVKYNGSRSAPSYPHSPTCWQCNKSPAGLSSGLCVACANSSPIQWATIGGTIAEWSATPPKTFTREKSTEVIIGYRIWRLNKDNGVHLQSGSQDTIWPWRRAVEKTKFAGEDGGIHACKTVQKMLEILNEYRGYRTYIMPSLTNPTGASSPENIYFGGEISLWGDVDEYTEGYKAEFGYPRKLFVGEQTDPCTIMELEDAYGIPCEFRPEFNKPDPTSLWIQSLKLRALYPPPKPRALYPPAPLVQSLPAAPTVPVKQAVKEKVSVKAEVGARLSEIDDTVKANTGNRYVDGYLDATARSLIPRPCIKNTLTRAFSKIEKFVNRWD